MKKREERKTDREAEGEERREKIKEGVSGTLKEQPLHGLFICLSWLHR